MEFRRVPARPAAVLGGNRIPFARSNGPYAQASNQDMLTATLDGLVARFGLQDARLGEVAAGAVLKHARDFNLTREAVLGIRLETNRGWYQEHGRLNAARSKAVIAEVNLMCQELRPDVLTLVDAFAIPDEAIAAPIALGDEAERQAIKNPKPM